jgi:uncharacterized protein YkwD
MAYVIEGTHLQVDGKDYPNPLIERDGADLADATDLARFLHLSVTDRNGLLVFSSPDDSSDTATPAPPPADQLDTLRTELLGALNDHRSAQGLDPLTEDPVADEAAAYQAQDMAERGIMGHQDASGRSPMQRYSAFGGHAAWYGENVGWYGLDLSGASALWNVISKLDDDMMAEQPPDDGHRQNILDVHYESVGIGVSVGSRGVFLAEDFVGH